MSQLEKVIGPLLRHIEMCHCYELRLVDKPNILSCTHAAAYSYLNAIVGMVVEHGHFYNRTRNGS